MNDTEKYVESFDEDLKKLHGSSRITNSGKKRLSGFNGIYFQTKLEYTILRQTCYAFPASSGVQIKENNHDLLSNLVETSATFKFTSKPTAQMASLLSIIYRHLLFF